jgi:hydrogenase-1 operon protein HyaF
MMSDALWVGAGESAAPGPRVLATALGADLVARCPQVGDLVPRLAAALAESAEGRVFDLGGFGGGDLALLADLLGAGEVTAQARLPDGTCARIEESVMTGLWRVQVSGADDVPRADYLEVGSIPQVVRTAAETGRPFALPEALPPAEAVAARPLLVELGEHLALWQPGMPNAVITLSHQPLGPADFDYVRLALGEGPAQVLSRGYGQCRVACSATRGVWWVSYLNASGVVILETIEIGDVPGAALAAPEDLRDSADRLAQIHAAYFA